MAQRPNSSRHSNRDLAETTGTAKRSSSSPKSPSHSAKEHNTSSTSTGMGRNKNNRRRKQGQKKAAEQQQHSRNVSSASSSTAPPATPATTTGFPRDPQGHSSGGSDEEEEEKQEGEEEVAGVVERKDDSHDATETNKENSIEDELLDAAMGPTTLPPIPFRRVPVTPQRQLVGGLWSAAFVALMVQAILEPESDIEWREQMRGPAFSLATLGLCMSVIYMRGLEIQFSQFFKAWTRTPMERYG